MYKNSHNLAIVTGNGPNNFQPVARKRPRKRLVMPRPWHFFLVSPSTEFQAEKRGSFVIFLVSKIDRCFSF